MRRGDPAELEALLDEDVRWQGLRPELFCANRREVMSLMSRFAGRAPRFVRIEAQEFGDRVVVSVEGPDFPENEVQSAGTPRSLVFTFRDGHVVRMDSLPDREAAFALASA